MKNEKKAVLLEQPFFDAYNRHMNISVKTLKTPLGWLRIETEESGVTGVKFVPRNAKSLESSPKAMHHAELAAKELDEYFAGKRTSFTVPLDPRGSSFQKSVWKALAKVKSGEVLSYGELAKKVGHPGAARAVGSAMKKNPLCLIVPCHRVLPSMGTREKPGAYGGGAEKKKWLLEHEKNA